MRLIIFPFVTCLIAGLAQAKDASGYIKRDGTYVQPHQKTAPNKSRDDNYSTKGNTNPFTGAKGSKPTDANVSRKKP